MENVADYQINSAFRLAKEQGRKPFEVASELANTFQKKLGDLATVTAHPSGFVNIVLAEKVLCDFSNEVLKTNKLPLQKQEPRTIFFDYGGANIAKQLHIGHLRSPIIGEALKRVFRAFGHKTISDTFFGDWGLQMGLVLASVTLDPDASRALPDLTLDMLNEIYPAASKRSKEDETFYKRAEEITALLQKKTEPWFSMWQSIRAISVAAIMSSYKTLGCTFDTQKGESDAADDVPKVIELLKKHGAHESEGCLILDVKKDSDLKPLPPVILQKSNGGDLYATSDLAMLYGRYRAFKPQEFIYCTDARQELHMEQVFRASKIGKLVPSETKLTHVAYGTMNGADGKPFKTRAGDTIKLDDIIKMVTESAQKRIKTSPKTPQNDPFLAQKVGISALKFADLSNSVRKDYIFDVDKFTAFEGKTGPYLLYTVARINSILKKSHSESIGFKSPPVLCVTFKANTPAVRAIVIAVVKLCDAFQSASENYTLNGIVEAAWALANKFNALYANETILGNAENVAAAALTRAALLFALDTLAIEPVEEM